MEETIITESPIGERLTKMPKGEIKYLIHEGKSIQLTEILTVGREKGNSIVIDDKLVSRRHAEIQQIRGSYYIKDLGSSNGTYINGKTISKNKYIKLQQGDTIKLGGRIILTLG